MIVEIFLFFKFNRYIFIVEISLYLLVNLESLLNVFLTNFEDHSVEPQAKK